MAHSYFKVGYEIQARDGHPAYRVEEILGEGGFAQTFRAEELTPKGRRRQNGAGSVCLKVTTNAGAWHGEAYFGSLTQGMPNVVQLYDSFPYRTKSGMKYVLVMQLMMGGTVGDWLDEDPTPWTAGQVINGLRGLSRTVGALHASGASHRDITPWNVFIEKKGVLCLGDFGIAKHGLNGHGPHASVFNPAHVPASMYAGSRPEWLPSDDVFQIGLLGLYLALGERVERPDWRSLRYRVGHAGLKSVLQRATGPRPKRYKSATDLREALAEVKK